MLKINKLTKIYNSKSIYGIRDVSFSLKKNSITCLAGPSGSGKTTLFQLIFNLIKPDSGTIEFLEECQMAALFQGQSYDENLTVFEFVDSHIKDLILERETRINQVRLTLTDLELTNEIHKKLSSLSAGQKQRAILAGALVQNPNLLLLDEPFAHLDFDLRNELMNLIYEKAKTREMSVLWITHNLNEALPFCENIMLMDHGECKAFGAKEDIYNNPPNYFSAQFLGHRNVVVAKKISPSQFSVLGLTFNLPPMDLHEDFLVLIPFDEIILSDSDQGVEALIVSQLYYGNHYLIETLVAGQTLYFKNKFKLSNKRVQLLFSQNCFSFIAQI